MNTVIILLGPTGVGKTGAAVLLAQRLNTEIISADSMQIYRHMDIGTAKPAPEQLAAVRHHMISIIEPSEDFSVGRYLEETLPLIDRLHTEGRIPLIVGGTGLYIKAFTRGIFSGPSADWTLRTELLEKEESEPGSLYRQLCDLDPDAAARIKKQDLRRIVRALEVCLKTETGISELQRLGTKPLPYHFVKVGLTRDRKELYRLIEERVDSMLSRGLVREAEGLLAMNPGKTALQAIGYKEIALFLNGTISSDEAGRLIKKRSKAYAKRQLTWFRQEKEIHWIDVTGIFHDEEICRTLAFFLTNRVT